MKANEVITQSYQINKPDSDTLYLKLFDSDHTNGWDDKFINFDDVLVKMKNHKVSLLGQPKLQIIKSETNKTNIKIYKESNGMNGDEALKFAKNIKYEWQQVDSLFYFRRYFTIEGKQKVKGQELTISFEIPVGKVIYMGENIDYITSNIDFIDGEWIDDFSGQYLIMTEDGLQLLNDYKENLKDATIESKITSDSIMAKPSSQQEIELMKKELEQM